MFLRYLGRAVLVLLAIVLLLAVFTEMGRYIARAAWEEARILAARRSIAEFLADSTTPPRTAAKLRLVREAREFAVARLGLRAEKEFTTFVQLERDTLVLVLSASQRDTLAAYTWWFPVVGRFPYKGFFDFGLARRTAESMRRDGYDTYVRPASAFSTLGWFNDPLLSTTIGQDSAGLAGTVIHELLHTTIFVKGSVAFNESFASFVGARGSVEFFRSRGDARNARRAELEWEDDKVLGTFWEATAHKIDSVFAIPGRTPAARIAARDTVYELMRRVLRDDIAPRLRTIDGARFSKLQLDNASLIARRTYASDLYVFDELHRRAGGKVKETVALIQRLVEGAANPDSALRAWIAHPK